jgi:hypothetical protein
MRSLLFKVRRAIDFASRFIFSQASIEHTLAAHRFLMAIGYRGQSRGRETLEKFEGSGYTFDDLVMAFAYLRMYGRDEAGSLLPPEQVARENLRIAGWTASEQRKRAAMATSLPEALRQTPFCEEWVFGNVTLVLSASPEMAARAAEALTGSGVGGVVVPARTDAEWTAALEQLGEIRKALAEAGFELPRPRVVAVGCDPVRACASEWLAAGARGAFETELQKAARGEGSGLAEVLEKVIDESAFLAAAYKLSGAEPEPFPVIDPAVGFLEREGARAKLFLTRYESLHLLALPLCAEEMEQLPLVSFEPIFQKESAPDATLAAHCDEALVRDIAFRSPARNFYSDEERETWSKDWAAPAVLPGKTQVVYVFPHIPKTAGSSVAHHFRETLKGRGEYVHVRHETDAAGIKRDHSLPFQWRDSRLRARAKVIFGHGVKRRFARMVPGRTPREIITLREPAERLISHYNFWMHVNSRRGLPVVSFEEWYANEPRNYQVFWTAQNYLQIDYWLYPAESLHEIVDAAFEEFWMVSTVETFTRDMEFLMKELGLPNVSERKNVGGGARFKKLVSLTDDLRARLRAENALEYRLYDKWLERARARCA